jgi:hypothetical protein
MPMSALDLPPREYEVYESSIVRARSSSSGARDGRSRSNLKDMNPERYGANGDCGSDGISSPSKETTSSIRGSRPSLPFPASTTLFIPVISVDTTVGGSGSPISTTSFHFGDGNS